MNTKYDYIITGGGAAGLLLAIRMSNDQYFQDKSILIIDQSDKTTNDRTWCFWSQQTAFIDNCVSQQWPKVQFKAPGFNKVEVVEPFKYKMVHSADFYQYAKDIIHQSNNITWLQDKVEKIEQQKSFAVVRTTSQQFESSQVFNSILFDETYRQQSTYAVINQHFVGWFIKATSDSFNPDVATFMDFDIPQKSNTRFMYVLPTSEREALVEYTLFSKDLLDKVEYETAIRAYLEEVGIHDYEIVSKEYGCIPMTSYPFWNQNSQHVHHIGIAGGWAKPSTGYTFRNAMRYTEKIVQQLTSNKSPNVKAKNQFWLYDLLLLDILNRRNDQGQVLFTEMFKHNSFQNIFKFLDESTTFLQNMKTIWTMPKGIFIDALWRRITGRY